MMKLRNKRIVALSVLASLVVFITFISLAIGLAWYETYTNEKNRLLLFTHKASLFYQLRFKELVHTLDLYANSNHSCKNIKEKLQQASLNDVSILMVLITQSNSQKVICSDFKRKLSMKFPRIDTPEPVVIGPLSYSMFDKPVLILSKPVLDQQKRVYIFLNIDALTPSLLLATNPEISGALFSSEQKKPLINFKEYSTESYVEPPLLNTLLEQQLDLPQISSLSLRLLINKNLIRTTFFRHALDLILLAVILSSLCIYVIYRVAKHRLSLQRALKLAIENGDIIPYYQPVIELENERCIGCEVLARWKGIDNEVISSDIFISIAEKFNLILPLTELIIKQALSDLHHELSQDHQLHVAFNISARHFENDHLLNFCLQQCQQYNIEPKQIIFELTETQTIDAKNHHAIAIMELIKEHGIEIALDDFGTGFSSMSYLHQFSFNYLKIDKQFIMSANSGAITETLADSMIKLAKRLHMKVIAEGVEEEKHLKFLKERDVEYAQGFLFSRPIPIEAFLKYLKTL